MCFQVSSFLIRIQSGEIFLRQHHPIVGVNIFRKVPKNFSVDLCRLAQIIGQIKYSLLDYSALSGKYNLRNLLREFFQAFQLLHNMYHEATACHVYNEILELLGIIFEFLKCLRDFRAEKEVQNYLMACKDWSDIIKKLFTLLNSYSCGDMRRIVLGMSCPNF